jgi:hypothetical protein
MTPRRFMRRATNMLLVIFGTMAVYMGITAVTGIIVRNQSAAAQSTQPPLSPGTDIPAATTAPANPPVTVLPAIPAGAKVGDLIQHPSLVGNDIALRVTDTAPRSRPKQRCRLPRIPDTPMPLEDSMRAARSRLQRGSAVLPMADLGTPRGCMEPMG